MLAAVSILLIAKCISHTRPALHGHTEVVRWLLGVNTSTSDVNTSTSDVNTSTSDVNTSTAVVNCQDSCGITPLMDALRAGHLATAELLLYHNHVRSINLMTCFEYWM